MLRIVTGPFQPDLEAVFVENVRHLKTPDPLAPLLVVVPSDSLRRRVKRLLCLEHDCAVIDVHVLTFYQLALRLLDEAGGFDSTSIRREYFFHELVHQLLRRQIDPPSSVSLHAKQDPWSDLAEMPGAWGALLATLRDLKDAKVDSERAAEALSQSQIGALVGIRTLLTLYRDFLDEKERMQVVDEDDLALLAEPCVGRSSYLARQRRILYYGFYDVTQVQLDFFQAVARVYPTTLFFPLIKGDTSYAFAERFFERHLYGLMESQPAQESHAESLTSPVSKMAEGLSGSAGPCRILSASGPFDEVTIVAKDILSLVEERGYAFHDIGVVARTMAGYETLLPRVFDQHAIPFTSALGRSLSTFPYVKSIIQLWDLRVSGLRRDRVMALLSSPFMRLTSDVVGSGVGIRPDLWDLASRRLGITKGLEEWRRLTTYLDKDLPLRDDDEDELKGPRIPVVYIKSLWTVVTALGACIESIPDNATWERYIDYIQALCKRWLDVAAGEAGVESERMALLTETLDKTFDELKELRSINREVSLADFTVALHRLLEHTVMPLESAQGNGVQVLDAMAARGLSFRALYVIGLNEKRFPRDIHEDAFLRDEVRRLLEVDLGFKIQEKLNGYDEEKLLFALLCRAATEQLTLLYQRTDETGRSLLPSSYLAELQKRTGVREHTIPRRLSKKFQESPYYQLDRLTPSEVAVKLLLERRVPRRLLKDGHSAGHLVERGLMALQSLERAGPRLGDFDAIIGPVETVWQTMKTAGVSPTSLQEYASCPFRYFAKQVLRLRLLPMVESVDQVGPLELGALAHGILRTCLETLKTQGYFADRSSSMIDPMTVLDEAAGQECARFAATHPVGYPLVWRLHQERLTSFLRRTLRDDLEEMAREGWEPVLFEKAMTGHLTISTTTPHPEDIPVVGRLDRVDWSPAENAYRIIDYKFKSGRMADPLDKNLRMGAARATRLQPPLYLSMMQSIAASLPGASADVSCRGVWFYYLAPQWDAPLTRVSFPGDAWTSDLKESMTQGLAHVLSGIREGRFFLYDSGRFCERCDYRLLCRRTHQPSAWRARTDYSMVASYRALRSVQPPKSEG
ncbi:MAG: PD-(D/E)XK nuclease family protein [Nitrospiraceae bacterium]